LPETLIVGSTGSPGGASGCGKLAFCDYFARLPFNEE
jgi:hypothetical protein